MTTAPATTPRAKAAAPAKTIAKQAVEVSTASIAAPVSTLNGYEDVVGFGKEAIEAWVQAGTILSKGFQDIGSTVFGLAKSLVEENVAVSKQFLGVKTLREVVDLHASFSRSQFDRLVSESSHLSDMSVKLVEESFAPIGQKVNAVIDKFVASAA
jgi:phasin family protein